MRMTLYTENAYVSLGVLAVSEWHLNVLKSLREADALMLITDDLITRVGTMQVNDGSGFTEEYKALFLKILTDNKGKHLLQTLDWFGNKRMMRFVELINQGSTFDEAEETLKQERKPLIQPLAQAA
jgi:hypothetical protein